MLPRCLAALIAFATTLPAQPPPATGQEAMELRERAAAAPKLPLALGELVIQPRGASWKLDFSSSVAAGPNGVIYVLQRSEQADPVIAVDARGRVLRSWGKGMFEIPHSIRVDPQGNLWTVDAASSVVYKFTPQGRKLLEIRVGGQPANHRSAFKGTTDIAFGPNGRLYISDGYANARILEYTAGGRRVREWGRHGTGPGEFHLPHGLTISPSGVLYVADRENGRIQKFDLDGKYLGEWNGYGKTFCITWRPDRGREGAIWIGTQPRNLPNGSPGWLMKLDPLNGNLLGAVESNGHHSVDATPDGELLTGVRPDKTLFFRRIKPEERSADVVIYGATSSGVAAAIQAARMGKTVLLLDPGTHVGGLTTGGLSWTDIGNKQVIGGVAREFYRRIKTRYDRPEAWVYETREHYFGQRRTSNVGGEDAMWTFEPKIASEVYREMMAERGITPILNARLDLRPGRGVVKRGGRIAAIVTEDGARYSGKMFIDATYEGDLMAKAGVRYTIGREFNAQYGEQYNGSQAGHRHQHQFPDGAHVSPFVVAGDPKSGLLPIIDPTGPGVKGVGDKRIQAYCFRMCLSNAPANRLPILKPEGYDERDHELLLRFAETGLYHEPSRKYDPIPNAKTDTNNHGAVSTDYMGANWDYPEGDYATRDRVIRRHEIYQKGYMWTLQNHPRVPEKLREWYQQWGLPKDEFKLTGGWPAQLYIREARRMVSAVVMTESHIVGRELAQDSVGMGAYGMDSHNVQRYVTAEGWVRNEGNVQVGGFTPYPISYRSIVPLRGEVSNLLVPVCLSASHIAYGSIRMEPVFMVLGQSAGTAAAMAIDTGAAVQDLDYAGLRKRLLADGQVLEAPASTRRQFRPKE
jgi:hypothetical protein